METLTEDYERKQLMKKSQSVPLVFALLFGLTLSLIPLTTAYSGSLNACQGNSATTASLKLGGRTITPSLLLQAAGNSPCPTGESSFSLVSLSRTILVSPYGNPTQNGTTLLAAMFFIGVSHPSATNPWLLKLEPGLYDLGNLALPMLPYVDLEGSGEGNTLISSTIGAASPVTGTLIAASHSQVRFVSIASSGSNTNQITVFVPNGTTQASFLHVTLSASSPGGSSNFGLYNNCGCPADAPIMLRDSTVNVSGPNNSSDTALYNDGGLSRSWAAL